MPSNVTNHTVLQDPVFAEDKLPQPFRRIDKLLNELIDGVVRYCDRQEAAVALRKQLDALPATSPTYDKLVPPVKLCTLAERCCILLHEDDTASVLDLETSAVTATFEPGIQASCMATHDSFLALASATAVQIRALALQHGAPAPDPICQAELRLEEAPSSVSFAPAGSLLAVCAASGITMLHCVTDASHALLTPLHHNLPVGSDQDPVESALHAKDVQVAWQRDTGVAAFDASKLDVHGMFGWQLGASTLQLWSIQGTELASSAPSATWSLPGSLSAVSQSDDGSTLALGLSYGAIALWDCRLGVPLTVVQLLAGAVVCMAFAPTQRQVLAIGMDGTLVSVEAHGSYRQRVIAKHPCAPARLFLPRALEPCAVVIDAQPWEGVPTSEEILVYDIQSKAFVGKVGVNNLGRAGPTAHGALATADRDVATVPRSHYTSDGITLVRVTRQQAEGAACSSRVEIVRLEDVLRGQSRAAEGSVMVQRFLHDVQQQQQQTKPGQQQGPRPRVSIADDGPTSTLDSFAQPTYSNEPRLQSCASSVTLDNDRGSTAAPVKMPPVPEDALEAAALQGLMEAIALRCGGRRRRDRKVLRGMSSLAAELAEESNYSRTGLGLVLQT